MTSAASKVREQRARPTVRSKPVDIRQLALNGQLLSARIYEALLSAETEQTIVGANLLTLRVLDPNRDLSRSKIFSRKVEAKLGDDSWVLVHVGKSGDELSLVFEDRDVNRLRAFSKPRKAARDRMTRAEFAKLLVREAGIPTLRFFSPQLHKVQPIESSAQRPTQATKAANKDLGLAPGAAIEVKGVRATPDQRNNIERVLDVGDSQSANRKVQQAAIMTITEEAVAVNVEGGDRDSVGLFQQRASQGWPASRDIETDAAEFYRRAIAKDRANPTWPVARLCHEVQRNFDTATKGAATYGRWESEAASTLDEYDGGGTGAESNVSTRKYEFTRGQGAEPEDTWTTITRLAEEVGWRCFLNDNTVYFVSDLTLKSQKPRLTIDEDLEQAGIEEFDYEWDVGKKVNEGTITARTKRWSVPPGASLSVADGSPAQGRWIVESVREDLFTGATTIQVTRPRPPLPEPAASDSAGAGAGGVGASVGGAETVAGSVAKIDSDGQASAPEEAPAEVQAMIAAGNDIVTKPYSQKAPRTPNDKILETYDCSSTLAHVLCVGSGGKLIAASDNVVSGELAVMFSSGPGKWVTIYANAGHTYMEIAGVRIDTSGGTKGEGPRWRPAIGARAGFSVRHPEGL